MRCNPIQPTNNFKSKKNYSTNFKGIPSRVVKTPIKDWHDAVSWWERLKSAKFLDIHSDGSYHAYRYIREENYSFLDKLTSYIDKSEFIQRFCEFTGFPNLRNVSNKIDTTFKNCLSGISRDLNYTTGRGQPYKVLDYGYDPTCSLGLKKALPGSDLDKGYIIIEGNHSYKPDEEVVNEFSGELWNNLDQRIVSLNHPDTFPNIYTKQQVLSKLNWLAPITNSIISRGGTSALIAGAAAVVGDLLLGPFGVPIGLLAASGFIGDSEKYENIKDSDETYPYTAGEFNREVAKKINSSEEREDAKNFAFFIETVDANSSGKYGELFNEIRNSKFVRNSNVTQIGAWQRKINGGYLKQKLRNREQLMQDFNYMTTEEKYELIKDLVKYSSEDQSNKFSKYFQNDDDVKGRYESLLRALR